MESADRYCQELVRTADKDRFLTALFLPADIRRHALAVYAFNAEIASVRDRAREPLAGEVRLQWWRDLLAGRAAGGVEGSPVATALLRTIDEKQLPPETFARLIEAREFDLYDDPMPSLAGFEAYLRLTVSAVFELVGRMLLGESTAFSAAANHAGLAYGIAGLLRALPHHASRGQIYVPADVLARHHVDPQSILTGSCSLALLNALAEMRDMAREHYVEVDRLAAVLPPEVQSAFLPLILADAYLAKMESRAYDPFTTPVEISQLRRQWILWRAARRAP